MKLCNCCHYNALLARCYSNIYKCSPSAWGFAPNSDLCRLIPKPAGKILDFGCGYGKNFPHLLQGDTVLVGVDICRKGLEIASSRFEGEIRAGRVSLLLGDEDLQISGFDLVVCSGVIVDHLLERRVKIANWLSNIIQPGGFLFLTAFGRGDAGYFINGTEVEQHTYWHAFGFPVHYFDHAELKTLFSSMQVRYLLTKLKQDWYPGPHFHETHVLLAKKPDRNELWPKPEPNFDHKKLTRSRAEVTPLPMLVENREDSTEFFSVGQIKNKKTGLIELGS